MPNTRPTSHTPKPELVPTAGSDWRAVSRATVVTMLEASGTVVEVGHAQFDRLLLSGKIPDLLTPLVAGMLWAQVGQGIPEEEARAHKGFYELVNIVVTASLVNPRIVPNPTQDDEIAIEDLDFADKIIIYTIATQPLAVLHRFRVEQEPDVDAVPEGEAVQPATE